MRWMFDILLVQSSWSSSGHWRRLVLINVLFGLRSMRGHYALSRLSTCLIVDGPGSCGSGSLTCVRINSSGTPSITAICSIPSAAQHELDKRNEEEDSQKTPANPTECFDSLKNAADFLTSAPLEIRELSL